MALADHGALQQAVAMGLEIMNRSDDAGALATRVGEWAEQMGDTATGWHAHLVAFSFDQTLAAYAHLKALAGPEWPERAEQVWDILRTQAMVPVATSVFLHEGRIDDAIRACNNEWTSPEILLDVGSAAVRVQPRWVIDRLSREAFAIIEAGRSPQYQEAAALLALVRDAYRETDNDAGWVAVKSGILARHARKYTLVPLIRPL